MALIPSSQNVAETTTVRVYGQIDGLIEAESDQIFSWYIDVLNSNGSVAEGFPIGSVTFKVASDYFFFCFSLNIASMASSPRASQTSISPFPRCAQA
jgi:hypothetical protein